MTRSPHVQFARNVLCGLSLASALGCLQVAHAFEQLTPPAGWLSGGGAGGSVTGTKTAVNSMFTTTGVSSNASIRVAGRSVPIPALMKYTPQAQRAAAAAVMLHPGIRTAAAVAGWLGLAGLVYDQVSGLWTAPSSDNPVSDGFYYAMGGYSQYLHYTTACNAYFASVPSFQPDAKNITLDSCTPTKVTVSYDVVGYARQVRSSTISKASTSSCPSGWYITPAGCVQTPQPKTVTQDEAIEELIKHPMPADVPRHIPEPLPVELPEYQPMFIPTGNPVPNPSYNPSQPVSPSNQPFVQPGVKVEPAPSPSAPWQVDVKPVNRPTESPTGSTDPTTEPSTDTPREDGKEDRDFCDKHPESLACTELDTPEGEIPKSTFEVSYSIENSWGSGSCPSDKYATIAGRSIKVYDWAQTCDYVATYVRPMLLVLCALGALFIVMPGRAES